jgi:small ligand-binding sensory domain FIST
MLQFGAAVSTAADHQQALDEVVAATLAPLDGPPDLLVCFFSMHHAAAAGAVALGLSERTGTGAIIGCSGQGVIADGRELEDGPALALWAARMPGVDVRLFTLEVVRLDDSRLAVAGWPQIEPGERASVLMLADPFTFPAELFLEHLNEQRPGIPVLGGMVSGAHLAGAHRLLHGVEVLESGAVGAALVGPVDVRALVSQGCRPIGRPFVVTKGEGNLVQELGGRSAVERLKELVDGLEPREQALMRMGGLQVGQVIDEHKAEFAPGDFLVRQLAGADPETGAIAVGETIQLGQTLQFHVRDAVTAGEELELLLEPVGGWDARGVLLFSCNGRGERFFGVPDHDAAKVSAATSAVPMAGFFAQGELGPVGGRNFLHSYTASMAVFCEATAPVPAVVEAAEPAEEPAPPEPAAP